MKRDRGEAEGADEEEDPVPAIAELAVLAGDECEVEAVDAGVERFFCRLLMSARTTKSAFWRAFQSH